MSKVKSMLEIVFLALSDVIWLPWNNHARHDAKLDSEADRRNIGVTLAEEGWSPTYYAKVTPIKKEDHGRITEYLSEQMAMLEKLTVDMTAEFKHEGKVTKAPATLIREAFIKRWYHNGKLKMPKYEGVYAFQRGSSLEYANTYLLATGRPMMETIPCFVVEYKTEAERIADCMEENFAKDALRNDVSNHWPSIIKGAKLFYDATGKTATLSQITRLVSGGDEKLIGLGQKAYAILVLDARFPHLNIVDKITKAGMKKEGNREIDVGQEYGQSLDRDTIRKFEQNTRSDAKEPANPKDVEQYFTNPDSGKKADKPLAWSALKKVGNDSSNFVVRYILQACQKDTTAAQNLAALDKIAGDMNELLTSAGLFKDGKPIFPHQ